MAFALEYHPIMIFVVAFGASQAGATQKQNFTLSVPVDTTNHGDPNLICTPPSPSDFLLFYVGNYFAHAATVISAPGQSMRDTLMIMISALFYPTSGVNRGLIALYQHAATVRDPLRRAARAGALCMVVRSTKRRGARKKQAPAQDVELGIEMTEQPSTSLQPRSQELRREFVDDDAEPDENSSTSNPLYRESTSVSKRSNINGLYHLPKGYSLRSVPSDAAVEPFKGSASAVKLSSTFNIPKTLIAILQFCYAISTLYRARGDQIDQYGYAAFGLTVAPYALMSLINLLGNLATPTYPCVFLVRIRAMQEAEGQGGKFDGAIGRLGKLVANDRHATAVTPHGESNASGVEIARLPAEGETDADAVADSDMDSTDLATDLDLLLPMGILGFLLSAGVLLGIIGGLSHFEKGHSSIAQRVWTMTWLVFGVIMGWVIRVGRGEMSLPFEIYFLTFYAVFPIGSFVVVGQMLQEYGTCVRF